MAGTQRPQRRPEPPQQLVLPGPACIQITELRDRQRPARAQELYPAADGRGLVAEQVDRRRAADHVEPAGPQAQPLGIHHRDRSPALVRPLQLPGGHGDHRLSQVDPDGQPGRAGYAGRLDQDGAAAAGHIEHAHPLADAHQGQQPLCDLVEEPHLVIAGRNSAEQAGDALLGILHVHATLPPLDST
jgi:hypothetical protein